MSRPSSSPRTIPTEGVITEIIYVESLQVDVEYPHGPFTWDAEASRWATDRRCDLAVTRHHTTRGVVYVRWYRRRGLWSVFTDRGLIGAWRSWDGGSATPTHISDLINAQIRTDSTVPA